MSNLKVVSIPATRNDHRVSSEWYNRPADQRFTDLYSLRDHCKAHAQSSEARIIDTSAVRVEASRTDSDKLTLILPGERTGQELAPTEATHWSFGQVCSLVKAPPAYLRKLPAALAAINLQHGLINHRAEKVKSYHSVNGRSELRAVTGTEYGRIFDHEVADGIIRVAGNGIGETHWKVPGIWGKQLEQVTKENTTLYASDRDLFCFLVDESHPIEIGKLPNGDADVVYRGFYVWNSEVGSKSFGLAAFLYRAVCQNRIIWGQRDFQMIRFAHTSGAPSRFINSVLPALEDFSKSGTGSLLNDIMAARQAVVARDDDERSSFLRKRGFTESETNRVIESVLKEEGKQPESVWDFVQGITAVARDIPHQDDRVSFERRASSLMEKVA